MKTILLAVAMAFGMTMVSGALTPTNAQEKTVVVKHKRGWSHRKKYGLIGAGAGAATGAVVTHSAKGAVVGGVVGGASGYLIGRHKDRKNHYRRPYKTKTRVD